MEVRFDGYKCVLNRICLLLWLSTLLHAEAVFSNYSMLIYISFLRNIYYWNEEL